MSKIVVLRGHLMLSSRYVSKILSSDVTRTIRLGIVKPLTRKIFIHSQGRIIAEAEILNTTYKKVRELDDNDAKLDGFKSRAELIRELKRLYGNVNDNDWVSILEFKIVRRLDLSDEAINAYMKPKEIAELALKHKLPLSHEERKILELIIKCGSLRRVAIKLYGTIDKRWIVRKVVRKALQLLKEKGIVRIENSVEFQV
ncbi:MAG: hypothetical protein B6V02_00190 [Thermoprotei archaeon ex4572_64]|nr:MAG: hypothetical protein B6V02_00190 [Thermoprotei archaeon ex4572_64]